VALMTMVANPLDTRRGRSSFGTLTAGMMLRGAVPAQVMYATCPLPRHRPADDVEPLATPRAEPPAVPMAALERDLPRAAPVADAPALQVPATATATGGRRAMTVRLDPVHHMRLRVVSSVMKRSSQQLIVEALDAYFARLPAGTPGNCACLTAMIGAQTK